MKIFISYAQKDHRLMHALSGALVEFGLIPLIAIQQKTPGTRLDDKVQRLIAEADCVVVLNTPNSQRSRWVQQEIGSAKALGKYIVPVKSRKAGLTAMLVGLEYLQFNASDPYQDFVGVAQFLRDFAKTHRIHVGKVNSDIQQDLFYLLHLPHALVCPRCKRVDVHVFVCLLCGEWVCGECGETIPPTSRANTPPIRSSANGRS